MGPDLTKYKVVYNDRVLRALSLEVVEYPPGGPYPGLKPDGSALILKPYALTVLVINEDGNLVTISDKAKYFQFIPVIQKEAQGNGGV